MGRILKGGKIRPAFPLLPGFLSERGPAAAARPAARPSAAGAGLSGRQGRGRGEVGGVSGRAAGGGGRQAAGAAQQVAVMQLPQQLLVLHGQTLVDL